MSDSTPDTSDADVSTTKSEPPSPMGSTTVAIAAFILALPAAVPLLVLVDPGLVPFVDGVDTSEPGLTAFLVGMSVILLAANWGFLYIVHRYVNQMARGDSG